MYLKKFQSFNTIIIIIKEKSFFIYKFKILIYTIIWYLHPKRRIHATSSLKIHIYYLFILLKNYVHNRNIMISIYSL